MDCHKEADLSLVEHSEDGASCTMSCSPAIVSRMKLNDNKAGMEGLDRDKINKIIYEASNGSSFYKNELKKEEQVNRRIAEQHRQLNLLTPQQILIGEQEADKLLARLEAGRDLSRTIVHIDMDAFYAAVEMRDNPDLRNKPMAVGGNSMLSTSNYLARRYGVRAAMPGFIGRKLCPSLVIVPLNFEKYTAVSKQVRAIMAEYDPNFAPMSLDEAYLDITDYLKKRETMPDSERTYRFKLNASLVCTCEGRTMLQGTCSETSGERFVQQPITAPSIGDVKNPGTNTNYVSRANNRIKLGEEIRTNSSRSGGCQMDVCTSKCEVVSKRCPLCGLFSDTEEYKEFGLGAEETVNEIRARIEAETSLTASAGIAPNTMLSKVCSDKNKPNGQYRIRPTRDEVMTFVNDLPIRKVCGIGKVSEKLLNALGVEKCSDLHHQRAILYHLYSKVAFENFMEICLGLGSTRLENDGERKSMSVERTFSEISKPQELYSKCQELCDSLSEDLVARDLKGKTVTIKLKTVDFKQMTRAKTIGCHTNDSEDIYQAASELLKSEIKIHNPLRLRLMGVRLSGFATQADARNEKGTIKGFFKTSDTMTTVTHEHGLKDSDELEDLQPAFVKNKSSIKEYFANKNSSSVVSGASRLVVNEKEANVRETQLPGPSHDKSKSLVKIAANCGTLLEESESRRYNLKASDDGCSGVQGTFVGSADTAPDLITPAQLMCPVCSRVQPTLSLDELNGHIDQCLNRSAIQEILSGEGNCSARSEATSSSKRSKTLVGANQPPKKKQKTNTGMVKIDSFFK